MKKIMLLIIIAVFLTMSAADVFGLTEINDCSALQDMEDNLTEDYKLVNDIDCSGFDYGDGKGFKPIGDNLNKFTGSFNGNYHTISGLTINRPSTGYAGLFGYADAGVVIDNARLLNVDILGYNYLGGLVGYNMGTISDSYLTGNVSATSW